MLLVLDPVVVMNLILASAVLVFGVWVYEGKSEKLALYVALGFGLFAVSHALTLLGYGDLQLVILPLRAAGYLAVIIGLCARLLRVKQVSEVPQQRQIAK